MGPMPRSSAATRPSRSVSSSTAAKPASPVTVVSGLPIRTLDRGCLDLRLFRRSVFTEQVPFNKVRIRASQHWFSLIDRASARSTRRRGQRYRRISVLTGRVLATDIAPNLLAYADHAARNVGLAAFVATRVMDGENLEVEPGHFDGTRGDVGPDHRGAVGVRRPRRVRGALQDARGWRR